MEEQYYTLDEVLARLGCSKDQIEEWVDTGLLGEFYGYDGTLLCERSRPPLMDESPLYRVDEVEWLGSLSAG